MDLHKLRLETAVDHQAVEGALPLMHQGLDIGQYVACLQNMYGVVAAWEERAAATAPNWLRPMLAARRRVDFLRQDLRRFGITELDEARPRLPPMDDLPSLLGAMYVMEGSTLGGQLIARHVATELDLEEGEGAAYFRGHGRQTGPMWKEFCDVLTVRVLETDAEAVVLSAKAMFAVFGAWVRQRSAIDGN